MIVPRHSQAACRLVADCVEKVEMPRQHNSRKSEMIADFGDALSELSECAARPLRGAVQTSTFGPKAEGQNAE